MVGCLWKRSQCFQAQASALCTWKVDTTLLIPSSHSFCILSQLSSNQCLGRGTTTWTQDHRGLKARRVKNIQKPSESQCPPWKPHVYAPAMLPLISRRAVVGVLASPIWRLWAKGARPPCDNGRSQWCALTRKCTHHLCKSKPWRKSYWNHMNSEPITSPSDISDI